MKTLLALLMASVFLVADTAQSGTPLPNSADARPGAPLSPTPQGIAAKGFDQSLDSIFAKWDKPNVPGCTLGVEGPGAPPLIRSYGSADLEHDVPIDEFTVFEAGSISKQFTAAAVLMLVAQGKLSLADDVRKYAPELPDYGTPITISELLGHTSGLRDWGDVEAIAGWPRTSRIYTQADVLDITARQKSLNYPPGTAFSYTNTGYNLLAIIVSRVTNESMAAFTRDHLFVPLGMSHTQWRDDFRRVVKGRAIAYTAEKDGYYQLMPFEDAYGNGGLLTTIDDLLRWNRALTAGELGDIVTKELVRQTTLKSGRSISYARGLYVQSYHGVQEISHSGATAAYRAWLGRYPAQQLSIALLCNAGDADSDMLAHEVADQLLPKPASVAKAIFPPVVLTKQQLDKRAGLYVDQRWRSVKLEARDGALRIVGGPTLEAISSSQFKLDSTTFRFSGNGRLTMEITDGEAVEAQRMQAWSPPSSDLAEFAGLYSSREAPATYDLYTKEGHLVMAPTDRRSYVSALRPLVADTFEMPSIGATVHFYRNSAGKISGLEIGSSRVYSMSFSRIAGK